MALHSQSKDLRILQWNCLSFRQSRASIQELSKNYDVIILCETWLNPLDNATLKGFVIVSNDRPAGKGGGTSIYIRNSIPFNAITTYNSTHNFESNAVSILTSQGELLIVSVHRPPNLPIDNVHLQRLLSSIDSFKSILLAGDFNKVDRDSNSTCNLGDEINASFGQWLLELLDCFYKGILEKYRSFDHLG
ncbi:hypothetical protein TSAR_009826 [Trichomalopsis sarcophagae]|uniref:Endonuclease/exonuclease/phosphatase domain-containing protein n=1 Tax=Trichomalopsis sarcophagae TaxID=543379 RepID=A0A232EGR4_9HYME|nr:hypothetical protein TSAR_009826 [Trichomalopsis sarcophagae]